MSIDNVLLQVQQDIVDPTHVNAEIDGITTVKIFKKAMQSSVPQHFLLKFVVRFLERRAY